MITSGVVEQKYLVHETPFIVEYDLCGTTHVPIEENSEWVHKLHRMKELLQANNTVYEFKLNQAISKIGIRDTDNAQLRVVIASLNRELAGDGDEEDSEDGDLEGDDYEEDLEDDDDDDE